MLQTNGIVHHMCLDLDEVVHMRCCLFNATDGRLFVCLFVCLFCLFVSFDDLFVCFDE